MMRALPAMLALLLGQPAIAQTRPPSEGPPSGRPPESRDDGWSVTVGAAIVASPVWQGSRNTALSLLPDLRIRYKDELFASIPEGIGWNAIRAEGWTAGPIGRIRFGRNERRGGSPFLIAGGSDALVGLGNIGAAFEVGGFVEKRFGPFRGRAELRRGLGGHDGWIADVSANYRHNLGRTNIVIGPRATFAGAGFLNRYFGIDEEQSRRSGLARYAASGGLVSYGIGTTVLRPLTRRSAVTVFTGFEVLSDKVSRSPLLRDRGQRPQFTAGMGYSCRFNL